MALLADINAQGVGNLTGGSPMAYGAPAASGFGLGLSVNPAGAAGNVGLLFNSAVGGSSLSATQSANPSILSAVPWWAWLAVGGGALLWFFKNGKH